MASCILTQEMCLVIYPSLLTLLLGALKWPARRYNWTSSHFHCDRPHMPRYLVHSFAFSHIFWLSFCYSPFYHAFAVTPGWVSNSGEYGRVSTLPTWPSADGPTNNEWLLADKSMHTYIIYIYIYICIPTQLLRDMKTPRSCLDHSRPRFGRMARLGRIQKQIRGELFSGHRFIRTDAS
ncbi:hypothetical protein GGTG_09729 [Gaeumannomyces tritici R3-111a-1]|uniref:Uncharacterized protein n=1 Tax=Gaeumannomyces tritici (strain R3-111a-1) TaxID=644352 RepID=J3P894_GAET3|nr:hypothetical protein GGTG_09729 [Gaeumannomyces tritici R3-111a-1]EJT72877.1 hypothetical protein GGTG_09729 [Gaeumannomyces tritici R3-111a-1]